MTPIRKKRGVAGAILLFASVPAFGAAREAAGSGPVLTVDQAIRSTLENNQDIKVEAYAPAIARANVLAALGQFDPALNFGRNYSRSYGYPSIPEALAPTLVKSDTYTSSTAISCRGSRSRSARASETRRSASSFNRSISSATSRSLRMSNFP